MATGATQTVAANSVITTPTIRRRKGYCGIGVYNGAVVITKPGWYKVDASITFTGSAGLATIVVNKNGIAADGITASATITTASTEVNTLNLSGIVKVYCNEEATITLQNTGVAINTSNVELSVVEV